MAKRKNWVIQPVVPFEDCTNGDLMGKTLVLFVCKNLKKIVLHYSWLKSLMQEISPSLCNGIHLFLAHREYWHDNIVYFWCWLHPNLHHWSTGWDCRVWYPDPHSWWLIMLMRQTTLLSIWHYLTTKCGRCLYRLTAVFYTQM